MRTRYTNYSVKQFLKKQKILLMGKTDICGPHTKSLPDHPG